MGGCAPRTRAQAAANRASPPPPRSALASKPTSGDGRAGALRSTWLQQDTGRSSASRSVQWAAAVHHPATTAPIAPSAAPAPGPTAAAKQLRVAVEGAAAGRRQAAEPPPYDDGGRGEEQEEAEEDEEEEESTWRSPGRSKSMSAVAMQKLINDASQQRDNGHGGDGGDAPKSPRAGGGGATLAGMPSWHALRLGSQSSGGRNSAPGGGGGDSPIPSLASLTAMMPLRGPAMRDLSHGSQLHGSFHRSSNSGTDFASSLRSSKSIRLSAPGGGNVGGGGFAASAAAVAAVVAGGQPAAPVVAVAAGGGGGAQPGALYTLVQGADGQLVLQLVQADGGAAAAAAAAGGVAAGGSRGLRSEKSRFSLQARAEGSDGSGDEGGRAAGDDGGERGGVLTQPSFAPLPGVAPVGGGGGGGQGQAANDSLRSGSYVRYNSTPARYSSLPASGALAGAWDAAAARAVAARGPAAPALPTLHSAVAVAVAAAPSVATGASRALPGTPEGGAVAAADAAGGQGGDSAAALRAWALGRSAAAARLQFEEEMRAARAAAAATPGDERLPGSGVAEGPAEGRLDYLPPINNISEQLDVVIQRLRRLDGGSPGGGAVRGTGPAGSPASQRG